jgi:hypothetical protein
MIMTKRILFVAILLCAPAAAQAALFYDFEGYAGSDYPGTALVGQDGWLSLAGTATVATSGSGGLTAPLLGLQSAISDPSTTGIVWHPAAGAGYGDGTVVSGRIKTNGADVTLLAVSVTANGDGFASVRFNSDGTVHSLTSDIAAYLLDTNNTAPLTLTPQVGTYTNGDLLDVALTLDFTNQTYTINVNNLTSPGDSFLTGAIAFRNFLPNTNPPGTEYAPISTALAEAGDIIFGTAGVGGGVFDNIAVTPIPEPSAALLLVLGGVGLLAVRRRRRN